MRNRIALLLAAIGLGLAASSYAAEFRGKVTKPDGTTPLASVRVALYKHDPKLGYYTYYTATSTDTAGQYVVSTSTAGVYLVNYTGASSQRGFAYPFDSYYYYADSPLALYHPETYNDVTPLTPTKSPTHFVVTDLSKVYKLVLVKLNLADDCLVTGPITINGVAYSSFSAYSGEPSVPATGGTLKISFNVTNLRASAISTNVQALAFLTRRDGSYADGDRSVHAFARKSQNLPAKKTTPVTLSVAIPASLMAASPPNLYGVWAFNVGIQMVTNQGVAGCKEIIFPVKHVAGSASATLEGTTEGPADTPPRDEIIPLGISEDGQILKWGPAPRAD